MVTLPRIGSLHALLGEKQQALVWLRRTLQVGNHNYSWSQRETNWDRLRPDPEFQSLMQESSNIGINTPNYSATQIFNALADTPRIFYTNAIQ
jgi:hypothetical protein